MLEDIAILTGGTVISEETGMSLEKARWPSWAASASKWAENTTIIDGAGDSKSIELASSRSASRSKKPRPTTTVKSCAWPSWPAALP